MLCYLSPSQQVALSAYLQPVLLKVQLSDDTFFSSRKDRVGREREPDLSQVDVAGKLALLRQDILSSAEPSKHPLYQPVCLGEFPLDDVVQMRVLRRMLASLLTKR